MKLLTLQEILPKVRIANYHLTATDNRWPNRRIPDLEFILVLAGEYDYITQDEKRRVKTGDVLFIEPGVLHTIQLRPGCKRGRQSAIHLELLPDTSWITRDYRLVPTPEVITRVNDFDYLRTRFHKLAEIYTDYIPFREALMSAIAREILIILASHWQDTVREQMSTRMQAMIAYIRENLSAPINRQDLARQFHVTPTYVNMVFKRELATTPSALINRERVMRAYNLMNEQGLSVKEAAHQVGFRDAFYFSRVFHRIMGIPPSKIIRG